ncbi:alpha/beta fold hydrolase [Streptomyces lichenis]|uniref:Alpha/beta hydrolase n=1 Tax=Streptomyces lichenis TaxID=2306967 RepID=A0ABT0IJD3_9ACTN|nr:alpha/beta fold hydrolase [Streptomyces lichenis]MCK8681432.1 alpha/beta hydrolase [Streptomyces lichenis]
MPLLTTSGAATLAYTDTGPPPGRPDAPTVVFGHGLLFGGWMFRPQTASLSAEYRCVTLDWRGQGDSPPAAGGYDMDTLTADVRALLDALGTGPVHFVGLSMGGFVGMRLAARHPKRLRSLSLLATTADGLTPARARRFRQLALVHRLVGIGPVRGRAAAMAFGASFLGSPESGPVLAEWERRLRRSDRAGIADAVRGVAGHPPIAAELGRVTVPTLVLVGEEDTSTPPPVAARIAARIPGARLERIPRAGHTLTLERPEAVTSALRAFLATA